ncbi:Capsular polysaccharide biosynthesis/export periplasmic protein WcbC [Cupriavidus sp. U2]|uniref:polysaccharide biosynthesis/export family protein n=1 Tax=Cupriavidus sp. U2 TaxID=2920269 RepID=UPI00129DB361|nr:polysaccharide biosynthesis/export family protein [Cupriavidus sp. U2]KAI3590484.1 Capsular polysaccharide biosynthesis/export periplasmic protein WcbC [Cupriavidus sp. U2]
MKYRKIAARLLLFSTSLGLTACGIVPSSGPTTQQVLGASEISSAEGAQPTAGIQIVDVNDTVARRLLAERKTADFASTLGQEHPGRQQFGPGDVVEVSVWEAPPATLFGAAATQFDSSTGAKATVLPAQIIDADGNINIPFAGQIKAAGRSSTELSQHIASRLKGKANQPQVITRLVKNATSYVTVVGDVNSSSRMELTAGSERLLDALANAGGVRQPVDKTTIQVTRGNRVEALPLQSIIRDPRQNVPLHAGDVVTALFQPLSFTVLGASGKNDEINFEAQGISLAQALARSGGLNDARADAKGVFIFRFESQDALDWPNQPVRMTSDNRVPVVYRVDLKDPASFFVAQSFPMSNKDLIYVSNAPVAEVQKFLNLVFSVVYPLTTVIRAY